MTFPVGPTNGQKANVNGVTYTYNSTLTAWTVSSNFLDSISANLVTANSISVSGVPVTAFPAGTKMLFQQTAAPTGWTKDTTHDNKALRVVSSTAGSGGSVAFTTAFASQVVSGSVANATATNQNATATNQNATATNQNATATNQNATATNTETTAGGTVGNTTLSEAQMPSHSHRTSATSTPNGDFVGLTGGTGGGWGLAAGTNNVIYRLEFTSAGSSNSHNHTFTGTSHTHTQNAHTHTQDAHTHTQNAHTHTQDAHTHTQNAHTHTFTGAAIDLAVSYVDLIIATKD
jgi:hypothetical protein